MKRFKLSILLIVAALSIAAVGSAALSSLSFERDVTAGQILVDTDPNVAIQITGVGDYTKLVTENSNGEVSIDLNKVINRENGGFNTEARFQIGTGSNGVIRITNNSEIPVTVSLISASDLTKNGITMIPADGGSNTITPGQSGDYYFVINTSGLPQGTVLNATLSVQGGGQ